ncbi:copper resistance CopC family protein [Actinomadura kijaniata]|uniref:copper resistance CopC family protein n=1 Tax=Actinomadura kijaniata TaxID=46161 RepID=UPI000834699E|nr:copper resistance protein CopC [Actinomadura kijaniata]
MMTKRLPSRRPALLAGLLAVFLAALGGLFAAPASAHTRLISSTPGKDATAANVTEVAPVFSDRIRAAKVVVRNEEGEEFQTGDAARSDRTVTQPLERALPPGRYTVAWRVVGEDGHPIQNEDLAFTAEEGRATATPTASAAPTTPAPHGTPARAVSAPEKKSSGAVTWVMIGIGGLLGIGIGMLIVFRARRRHPMGGKGE